MGEAGRGCFGGGFVGCGLWVVGCGLWVVGCGGLFWWMVGNAIGGQMGSFMLRGEGYEAASKRSGAPVSRRRGRVKFHSSSVEACPFVNSVAD